MKKCWFWQHNWRRDYDLEDNWQVQSYVDIKFYKCTKCGALKYTPSGDQI